MTKAAKIKDILIIGIILFIAIKLIGSKSFLGAEKDPDTGLYRPSMPGQKVETIIPAGFIPISGVLSGYYYVANQVEKAREYLANGFNYWVFGQGR